MAKHSQRQYDCVVVGSCVVDLLCRPVNLDQPIGAGTLYQTEPLRVVAGGITANSGISMARLGMRTAVCSCVGDDAWHSVVRDIFEANGVDTTHLVVHPTEATSTTVVVVAANGERSFFHCVGAPRTLDADALLSRMNLWRNTRSVLLGYYSLMPNIEPQLPTVLARLREVHHRWGHHQHNASGILGHFSLSLETGAATAARSASRHT